jgi:hypothetical protein
MEGGGLFGAGGLFGTGITGSDIGSIISSIRGNGGSSRPVAQPGGAPVMPMSLGFDLPFVDVVRQGGGSPGFRPTSAGASAVLHQQVNPVTGRATWFRPAGKPVLWSSDLSACKRVKKVATRARRAGGRR